MLDKSSLSFREALGVGLTSCALLGAFEAVWIALFGGLSIGFVGLTALFFVGVAGGVLSGAPWCVLAASAPRIRASGRHTMAWIGATSVSIAVSVTWGGAPVSRVEMIGRAIFVAVAASLAWRGTGGRPGGLRRVGAAVAGVALVWGLVISRSWRTVPTSIERPNVLVVTVSSLRADRVFGDAARGETWERLSAEGTRFERVLAASPDTAQAARQWFGVAPSGTSWVEAFAAEGYRTAAFVGADATGRAAGLSSGFAVFDDDHGWPKGVEAVLAGRLLQRLGSEGTTARRGDRVTDRAVRFLSRQRGAWLCWVHLEDPTAPYVPPHPFDERFYLGDDPTDPGARTLTAGDPIDAAHAGTLRGIRDAAYVEARYDGEVAWTGRQIARVLGALDDLGMASTTVVAVVGLHGENLRESSTWFGRDGSLTGPALHVPAWLRWPGRVPVARRVVAPAELGDVAATLLDLVPWLEDAAPPGTHSFRPVWMGEPAPREVAQAERTTAEGSETATLTVEGISQQLPGGARVWWPVGDPAPGSP